MSQPPNRATRRHPLAAAATAQTENVQIFSGSLGEPVNLNGTLYHTSRITGEGVIEFQKFLGTSELPAFQTSPEDTPGEMLINGALMMQAWDKLHTLLNWCIGETLPVGVERRASPDEMVAVVDQFFDQSGLRWLERMVKNLASRASEVIDRGMMKLADQTIAPMEAAMNVAIENVNASKTSSPAGTEPSLQSLIPSS